MENIIMLSQSQNMLVIRFLYSLILRTMMILALFRDFIERRSSRSSEGHSPGRLSAGSPFKAGSSPYRGGSAASSAINGSSPYRYWYICPLFVLLLVLVLPVLVLHVLVLPVLIFVHLDLFLLVLVLFRLVLVLLVLVLVVLVFVLLILVFLFHVFLVLLVHVLMSLYF